MSFKGMLPSIAVVAVLFLVMKVEAKEAQSPPAGTRDALDGFIAGQMEEAGIVGLGAALIVDKKVAWMRGYGYADGERRVPFTPDTIMNIGSISKTFTGVALMREVQAGRLSLDEDINNYLPFEVVNPNYPDQRITLRQLATHTSGITDRPSVYKAAYHYGGDAPESLGAFLEGYFAPGGIHYSRENFLKVKPGTYREYSNIGAALAGHIVEIAAGEKLNEYTKREIFTPLRMSNTGWFLSEVDAARHAKLYVSQYGLTIPIPLYGLTTYPDGGVRTSVSDLSRLFIALLNDGVYDKTRILDADTVKEMLRFHYTGSNTPDNVKPQEKNSGIFWQTKYDGTRIGYGGNDPGVNTEMLASLSRDVGVIVFANTSLSGEDRRYFGAIFDALWEQAEQLKNQK